MYPMKIKPKIASTVGSFAKMAEKRNQQYVQIRFNQKITANILYDTHSFDIFYVKDNHLLNAKMSYGEPATIKTIAEEFLNYLPRKKSEGITILTSWIKTLTR